MDEAEKLTALKKAYADTILNTAKEAAARVMVSEKRAVRLQREVLYTKDEGLRMLLRLKHTYDSKVGEAETMSLSQQGKIDELEAQLQEAEDIVSDLRGELSEVQDRLEKAKKRRALDGQNVEVGTIVQKNMSQDGHCFPDMITSELTPQADVVATNGKQSNRIGIYEGSKCYIESDSLKVHNHDPDFASIVMRSKEPELYRNGCTQRIRAFERYMFDEKLSLSGLVDDAKHVAIVGGNGKDKGITTAPKFDDMHEVEKNLEELKVRHAEESHIREKVLETEIPAILSLCRKRRRTARNRSSSISSTYLDYLPHQSTDVHEVEKNLEELKVRHADESHIREKILETEIPAILSLCRKRRRTARNRSTSLSSTYLDYLPHQSTEMPQVSGLSGCTTYHKSVNNNGFTANSSKKSEDEATASVSSPKSTEMSSHSAFDMVTDSDVQLTRPWTVQKETNIDKSLTENAELTRHECLSAESLEVLACNTDLQKDESVLEASHLDDLVATQPASNKFLKYTFHRKRKKESLSMPEGRSQNGTLEGNSRETKIGSLQQEQSSLMPALHHLGIGTTSTGCSTAHLSVREETGYPR